MTSMFCFQCEQTAQGKGCTVQGVCGKKADTANLQDELTSTLIELANSNEPTEEVTKTLIEGLFTTITNVNFDDESLKVFTKKVSDLIKRPNNFDIKTVWECNEDIRSLDLKGLLLTLNTLGFWAIKTRQLIITSMKHYKLSQKTFL